MLKEFKEFISKGNMIDLAIGVIVGGAFSLVVKSLVEDILMPFIGILLGKTDLAGLKWEITSDLVLHYGKFLQTSVNFIITAFCIFLIVKAVNKLRGADKEVKPSNEELLLTEIRDLLKK